MSLTLLTVHATAGAHVAMTQIHVYVYRAFHVCLFNVWSKASDGATD